MTFLMCAVLLLVGGAGAWQRFTDWRARPLVDDPEAEALVEETYAVRLDDTQPIDVVDGPWSRSDREVHGMTAPDVAETRAQFSELIVREWTDQQT